jgi:hypothetical protein
MPYIIRDTTSPEKPEQAALWRHFQARATAEGHSLAWVLWALIRQYVRRGLDA